VADSCAEASRTARPGAFAAGYAATLLVPCFGASALTYYFDLPMVALVWLALGLTASMAERPIVAGVAGALVLFLAGVFKWTALPIGGLMLAAVAASRGSQAATVRTSVAAALTLGCSFGAWQGLGGDSFATMLATTADNSSAPTFRLPGGLSLAVPTLARISGYGMRCLIEVLSPLFALPVLAGLVLAWPSRRARRLLLLAGAAHVLVFGLLVPPADGRFLYTLAPALTVAIGLGWLDLPRRRRWSLALVLAVAGAATLLEYHHEVPRAATSPWQFPHADDPLLRGRGVSLASGDERTTTAAAAERAPVFLPEREGVWEALLACPAPQILLPSDALGNTDDERWIEYRILLGRLLGEHSSGRITHLSRRWAEVQPGPAGDAALLLGAEEGLPAAPGAGWDLSSSFRARDGRTLVLWTRGKFGPCALPADTW